jgi:uncharacterized membrane protein YeaQ/YmgE (transglycosylase-associated protein family)
MTGLKPARVLHGRFFDISMSAVHSLLALAGLMLATFVVKFFIAYLMYGVIGAMIVATVVAFLSERRHGGGRSAG